MTNQEILANGPEGWTHCTLYNGAYFYFRETNSNLFIYDPDLDKWLGGRVETVKIRAREDIERIVYLESVLKGKAA
jgi:hypothetical protein